VLLFLTSFSLHWMIQLDIYIPITQLPRIIGSYIWYGFCRNCGFDAGRDNEWYTIGFGCGSVHNGRMAMGHTGWIFQYDGGTLPSPWWSLSRISLSYSDRCVIINTRTYFFNSIHMYRKNIIYTKFHFSSLVTAVSVA
jgi:hypothetical protein